MNANKQDAGGLLPCPFCGGRAEAGPCDDRFTRWFLACQSCGASTDTCKAADRFEAVRNLASSWNRRNGEQCRAAPAGGDDWPFLEEIGTNGKPTGYWIRKGSATERRFRGVGELERTGYIPAGSADERDARDEQEHDDELCFPEHEVEAMKLEAALDSAPAGSGEIVTDAMVEAAVKAAGEIGGKGTHNSRRIMRAALNAALLRKLQQGADYVMVPRVPTDEMETAHRMYGDTSDWWQAVIAASQGQEGGNE